MSTAVPLSNAVNRLWQPRPSLSACVRGVMSRNTLGVTLSDTQRLNCFPATPLCAVSWMFEGSSEMLESGPPARFNDPRRPIPARIMFCGPQNRPNMTWNPGPAHGMMLLLMPDALHRLTGIDATGWLNGMVDARDVLPLPWIALCEAVLVAPDDDVRVRMMQDFLDPLWQAARPTLSLNAHRYHDWAQGLAMRAATSAAGRSLRQVERRIKQWTGQPMRELMGIGRAEKAFFHAMAADADARPDWAGIAAESGYADQSHLCRATRRITGFPPEELRSRVTSDEAFWSYRLWE